MLMKVISVTTVYVYRSGEPRPIPYMRQKGEGDTMFVLRIQLTEEKAQSEHEHVARKMQALQRTIVEMGHASA